MAGATTKTPAPAEKPTSERNMERAAQTTRRRYPCAEGYVPHNEAKKAGKPADSGSIEAATSIAAPDQQMQVFEERAV
eukprot:1829576-Amphidinium_carterae.1